MMRQQPNEPIIVYRRQCAHKDGHIFFFGQSLLDLGGNLASSLGIFFETLLGFLVILSVAPCVISELTLYCSTKNGLRSVHFLIIEISNLVNHVKAASMRLLENVYTKSLSLSPY